MKFFVLLTVFAVLLSVPMMISATASNYEDQLTCADCAANAKDSGWCSNVKKCLPGVAAGPAGGACTSDQWYFMQCKVPMTKAADIALYVSLGLGVPSLLGILWCCLVHKKRQSKLSKIAMKTQFTDGIKGISNKYSKYIANSGRANDERLIPVDTERQRSTLQESVRRASMTGADARPSQKKSAFGKMFGR